MDIQTLVSATYNCVFYKGAQVGGRTWDLFDFHLFSLTSSALDHSATAPPLTYNCVNILVTPKGSPISD